MLKILYTGAFRFPDHDAAAKRVLANAMALKALGHDVFFAGWENHERNNDKQDDGFIYNGFSYESLGEFRFDEVKKPVSRLLSFLFRGAKTLKWLENKDKFDAIVAYNPPAIFALRLLRYCKKNNIKLVLDSTEWYESSHLIGGKYGIASIENFIRMKIVYPKFSKIIVISEFLFEYFKKYNRKDTKIVNIPPLLTSSFDSLFWGGNSNNCIRFIYAGSPGKKDDIYSFIDLLPKLNLNSEMKIVLRILGPEPAEIKKQLAENRSESGEVEPYLELLGRVPMESVRSHYLESDFSIIFREDKRYAQAGFPTKFVESISYGVPVIANKVGDIGWYMTRYHVGLIIDTDDVFKSLDLYLQQYVRDISLKNRLKKNCHDLSNQCFMFDKYIESIKGVL